jgi:hypothetical protein
MTLISLKSIRISNILNKFQISSKIPNKSANSAHVYKN